MAIYVGIHKVFEDDAQAIYEYGPDEQRVGRIQIDKDSGKTCVLSAVPGDGKQAYSLPAKRKLLKHWRLQEYPDKTCWAS